MLLLEARSSKPASRSKARQLGRWKGSAFIHLLFFNWANIKKSVIKKLVAREALVTEPYKYANSLLCKLWLDDASHLLEMGSLSPLGEIPGSGTMEVRSLFFILRLQPHSRMPSLTMALADVSPDYGMSKLDLISCLQQKPAGEIVIFWNVCPEGLAKRSHKMISKYKFPSIFIEFVQK